MCICPLISPDSRPIPPVRPPRGWWPGRRGAGGPGAGRGPSGPVGEDSSGPDGGRRRCRAGAGAVRCGVCGRQLPLWTGHVECHRAVRHRTCPGHRYRGPSTGRPGPRFARPGGQFREGAAPAARAPHGGLRPPWLSGLTARPPPQRHARRAHRRPVGGDRRAAFGGGRPQLRRGRRGRGRRCATVGTSRSSR